MKERVPAWLKRCPPWRVAFGVDEPEEFASSEDVWAYLDARFKAHPGACIEVMGPSGVWAAHLGWAIWLSVAEGPQEFLAYYQLVAQGEPYPFV